MTLQNGSVMPVLFQSTLPVWGATLRAQLFSRSAKISIHAPRVGSDCCFRLFWPVVDYFNPRSPCGERPMKPLHVAAAAIFQSTLPVWGATCPICPMTTALLYFNPRSPCGERRASLAGYAQRFVFQSTLPVWGATCQKQGSTSSAYISIHAPRVGSDRHNKSESSHQNYFNPRSPCGERLICFHHLQNYQQFQSTLPVWGATFAVVFGNLLLPISIHAPRVGSDFNIFAIKNRRNNFNPRSPCGERRHHLLSRLQSKISIHAPRVGSDCPMAKTILDIRTFQSTLPVWGATAP